METDKITASLKNYLETDPSANLEVVIELIPASVNDDLPNISRNEQIARRRQTFQKELQPLEKLIASQGGDILDSAWLNHTIKAKIFARSIRDIAQLKQVSAIDLARRLTRD